MSQEDNRKHTRLQAITGMVLYDTENGTPIGHLENISVEGMMLTSESVQRVGQELDVDLSLGTSINGRTTVRCRVRSVWSGENLWYEPDPSKKNCTGFEITSISNSELGTLLSIIAKLESGSIQTP